MALSTEQQILIEQRITNDGKSTIVAYLLWFFVGFFAGHRFYLAKTGSAVLMLLLTLIGAVTAMFGIGLIALAIVGIWLFIDIFLIPGIVSDQKEKLRQRLTMNAIIANGSTTNLSL